MAWKLARYWYWRHTADGQVKAEIERLKTVGEPLTARELHKIHHVPDGTVDLTEKWLNALAQLDSVSPDKHSAEYKSLPLIGMKKLEDLDAADTDECFVHAENYLNRIAPQIAELIAVSSQNGDVCFPVDFEDHMAAKMPHAIRLRFAADVLTVYARVCAIKANLDQLSKSLSALLVMPQALNHSRTMIEQLARCALSRVACDAILDAANRGQLSVNQLHHFEKQIGELELKQAAWLAYTGERVVIWEALDANASLLAGDDSGFWFWIKKAGPIDRAFILDALARAVNASQLDYSEASLEFHLLEQELKQEMSLSGLERVHYLYSALLLPMNYGAYVAFPNQEARCRITRAALLAHIFRMREGRWPLDTTELLSGAMSSSIFDPFSGNAILLRREEPNLSIYSVGRDLVDDGGKELNRRFEPDIVAVASPP